MASARSGVGAAAVQAALSATLLLVVTPRVCYRALPHQMPVVGSCRQVLMPADLLRAAQQVLVPGKVVGMPQAVVMAEAVGGVLAATAAVHPTPLAATAPAGRAVVQEGAVGLGVMLVAEVAEVIDPVVVGAPASSSSRALAACLLRRRCRLQQQPRQWLRNRQQQHRPCRAEPCIFRWCPRCIIHRQHMAFPPTG